jgi:hypothetical protein
MVLICASFCGDACDTGDSPSLLQPASTRANDTTTRNLAIMFHPLMMERL